MDEIKPDAPALEDDKPEKKGKEAKSKKTIPVMRNGEQTKCSKENLELFLDVGWKEVK